MLVIPGAELRRLLPISECIDAVEAALVEFSRGTAIMPARTYMFHPAAHGRVTAMSAVLPASGAMGVKILSAFERNSEKGLPLIAGVLLLQDAETGLPLAMMDSAVVTASRTAAASAVATRHLARKDAKVLAILGAGVQGRAHVDAICAVRPIESVRIWSRAVATAERLARDVEREHGISAVICRTPDEAAGLADVVCTTSRASTPILGDGSVRPGTHVNAVGAHTLETRELGSALVANARVVVDSHESTKNESGDVMIPISEGLLTYDHVVGELGEVAAGTVQGRIDDDDVTIFSSVGIAVEDVAAARVVYTNARRDGDVLEIVL